MGLCASKDKGSATHAGKRRQDKHGAPQKAGAGARGAEYGVEVKPETSPSQSTSGATAGGRKRSVVSGASRQTTAVAGPGSMGQPGANNRALKVLLLGSGESGKSTVLQQLKILHQNGFTQEELMDFKPFIIDNIVETGKDLLNARAKFNVPLESDCGLTEDDLQQVLEYSRPAGSVPVLPRGLAGILSRLWQLPSTRELLTGPQRSSFYLMDNAGYFFKSLDRISQPDYIPTVADVLRTRKKTSGIFDTTIEMDDDLKLHIYDVGGQRSERKKWIHCFDNVTLIIFCVSLSEYDQTLIEDKTQNRLQESLILFDSVVNSRWFTRTSVVLFLNKIDAFAEKLQTVPLEKYFPDYTGGQDINRAAKYILWRFVQLNRANLNIYPHVTQATDTSNIKLVFAAIKETILENTLKDSGVL
ncbi:AaceriABR158Wp [[Ashbya] aceris (nom. inval.)]|nr:AaceriABR158Wp [[Ashbya] aceris (nom. inval.)]